MSKTITCLKIIILLAMIIFSSVHSESSLKFLSENLERETLLTNENIGNKFKEMNKVSGSPLDGLIPGIGYSSDTQNIGRALCFNTDKIIKGGQSSILQFEEALNYKKLLQSFDFEADIKGGYGIFSTNDAFSYFKSLEENSYSLSINYFQKVSASNIMTYSYDPENILTEVGKNIYKNNTNPLFRVLCGDTLINSFEEGATLIISLIISFNSKDEKSQFDANIGVNVGSFIDVSTKVKDISQKYNLNGKIQIKGFQLGGDPSQLSKLLSSQIVECDINNTAACQESAKSLINYVSNIFPTQFTKDQSGIWTSPLVPLTKFKKDYKLEDIGFPISPSYITNEIETNRKELIKIFSMNDYYLKNLNFLVQHYPVDLKLDQPNNIFKILLNSLENNIDYLVNGNEEGSRALDCYEFPFKCIKSYQSLKSSLDNDIKSKVDVLLSGMQFYSNFNQQLYSTKCLPTDWKWKVTINFDMKLYPIGNNIFEVSIMSNYPYFSNQKANNLYSFSFDYTADSFQWNMVINTSESINESKGTFTCNGKNFALQQSYDIRVDVKTNPYYFIPFDMKK